MGERVEIVEVGPRDGLQNEPGRIPAALKVELVDSLGRAGFARIEAASFVSPKLVPQMADSGEVLRRIARVAGVRYAALVPNMRGFEEAMAAGADDVAVFASASEGFSKANSNASIAECLERLSPVAQAARQGGVPLRGYVSCVTDCPYDGAVDPGAVARVAARLVEMGCDEVSLGDTLGRATPERLDAMLACVCSAAPAARLAGHYHDTLDTPSKTSRSLWSGACACSTPRSAAWGAVPSRRGRRGTWRLARCTPGWRSSAGRPGSTRRRSTRPRRRRGAP